MTDHARSPWKVVEGYCDGVTWNIFGTVKWQPMEPAPHVGVFNTRQDAEKAATAVNTHDEMRNLLGEAHSWISDNTKESVDHPLCRRIYDAIAKAEGRAQ